MPAALSFPAPPTAMHGHRRAQRPIPLLPLLLGLLLGLVYTPSSGADLAAAPAPRGNPVGTTAAVGELRAWGNDSNGQLGDGTTGVPTVNPTPQGVNLPPGARVTAAAAGRGHSLALLADGTILAWGNNASGQLGNGAGGGFLPTPQTVLLPAGARAVAVAAGDGFSLALLADGTLLAWGIDASGQLGDGAAGSFVDTPQPVLLPAGARVIAIAAGAFHSLALLADGSLLAWGDDSFGQLGDGTVGPDTATPQPVALIAGARATAIAAGERHSLALLVDGSLFAWGSDGFGQLGNGAAGGEPDCTGDCNPTPLPVPGTLSVVAIAAGGRHSLALLADGSLLAWGSDASGQLGDGAAGGEPGCAGNCNPVPQPVPGVSSAVAIAAGHDHSLALLRNGTLRAWGDDEDGQLGVGAAETTGCECHPTPQIVPGVGGVAAIAAGNAHSQVLVQSSTVGAWGDDNAGQLGDGAVGPDAPLPQVVTLPPGAPIIAIAAGFTHSLALRADGTLLAWGDDTRGQLGDGAAGGEPGCAGDCNPTPQPVPGVSNVAAIAAGGRHNLALLTDGTVLAWGSDGFGQLGDGTVGPDAATPQPVALPGGPRVIAIAAGEGHSLALLANGTMLAWGLDGVGQLGDGTAGGTAPTPQPVALPGVARVTAISAGGSHSLALLSNGAILAWGRDTSGELGDGTLGSPDNVATPQAVVLPVGARAIAIAAGITHSLATLADGTMLSWGRDSEGQLGDGAAGGEPDCAGDCNPTPQPVALPSMGGAVSIAAGEHHSVAVLADGSAWSWGLDSDGQLGDLAIGTPAIVAVPSPVFIPLGVVRAVAVVAGVAHNLILATPSPPTTTNAANANATYGDPSASLAATVVDTAAINGGTVSFTVAGPIPGTTVVGTVTSGTVSGGSASASFPLAGVGAGSYAIGASYSGNGLAFPPSTDPTPATLAIDKAATSTTLGTPTPTLNCGSASVTVPVTVANTSNSAALTGGAVAVQLTQGATIVGIGSAAIFGADPVTVNVVVPLSGLAAGATTIAAAYNGDANFQGSSATPAALTLPTIGTTLSVPSATITYGDAGAVLTATVTSANGAALTGGTVTFVIRQGATVRATLTSGPVVGASPATASAALTPAANLGAGTYTVTATYNGTPCFTPSTAAGTLTIQRRTIWVKATDRTVGLRQPNPPTTPPAGCAAQPVSSAACWIELANGSTLAPGDDWTKLNLANLRFQYARNPPSTNSVEKVGSTYRITAFGLSSANYDVRYLPGTLTVVP
ncbi:MAG: Ig-like domain repeat protein [Thermomicrobiales bacterium]